MRNFRRKILVDEKEESEEDEYDEAVKKLEETKIRSKETVELYEKRPPTYFKPSENKNPEEEEELKRLEEEARLAKKQKADKKKKPAGRPASAGGKKKKVVKKKKKVQTFASDIAMEPKDKPFQLDRISLDEFVDRDVQLNHKFEYRSDYINYVPSDDPREREMEALWLKNR